MVNLIQVVGRHQKRQLAPASINEMLFLTVVIFVKFFEPSKSRWLSVVNCSQFQLNDNKNEQEREDLCTSC